jgi:hypothetical protein
MRKRDADHKDALDVAIEELRRWLELHPHTGCVQIKVNVNQGGVTSARTIREEPLTN